MLKNSFEKIGLKVRGSTVSLDVDQVLKQYFQKPNSFDLCNFSSNLADGTSAFGSHSTLTDPFMRKLLSCIANREAIQEDHKRDRSDLFLTQQRCVMLNHHKTLMRRHDARAAKEAEAAANVQRMIDARAIAAERQRQKEEAAAAKEEAAAAKERQKLVNAAAKDAAAKEKA